MTFLVVCVRSLHLPVAGCVRHRIIDHPMKFTLLFRFCLWFPLAVIVHAVELPAGGEPLVTGDPILAFEFRKLPHATDAGAFSTVDVDGPGFQRAWRVATVRDVRPMASLELHALNARAMAKGDVGMIHFFIRATEITDETGAARLLMIVRKDGAPAGSSYEGDFSLRREWQEIHVPFRCVQDYATQELALMFRFGFKRQTVEIGRLEVVSYGKSRAFESLPRTRFQYAGREAGAAWRQAALDRIERLRKGDFAVRVTDASGQPVPGARLRIEQRRSAFQWGSSLMMSRLVQDTPENLRYREKVLELFNAASTENDLKWPAWYGEALGRDPGFSHEQTLAGLGWLRAHGFHTRGHVLVWPGWSHVPKYVHELRDSGGTDRIQPAILDHIREISRATQGLLDEWDVLNEPYSNHDVMDLLGRDIMPEWFKVAREENPQAGLFFNDFGNHDATIDRAHVAHFEATTRFLLDHGAPVTGLGIQAHFDGRPSAPAEVLALLDRYQANFNLPVRITEFDVWTFDEELQADYTRDFLILCFSHPSVVGVQLWGFWEKAHWRPPAALYRADWSPKPNADVYRSLVLDQWRTRLSGHTTHNGTYAARGFFGDYVAIVDAGGQTVTQPFSLRSGQPAEVVTVRLP